MTFAVRRIVQVAAVVCLAILLFAPDAYGQAGQNLGRFQHDEHATFQCAECHSSGSATAESNRTWCADCHHVNAGFSQCRQCHTVREIAPAPLRALVSFRLPPAEIRTRSLLFDHTVHAGVGCASCHSEGAQLLAESDCASCHSDHHRPDADCLACHEEPAATAHPAEVHLDLAGCGAAGCHVAEGIDYAIMLGERDLCLSCHAAEREHEQPEPCAECHLMGDAAMAPRGAP
jgi:hypothetical protein